MSQCFRPDKMYFTKSLTASSAYQVLYGMGVSLVDSQLNARYSPQRGVFVFNGETFVLTHEDFKTLLDLLQTDHFVALSRNDEVPSRSYENWVENQVEALFPSFGSRTACTNTEPLSIQLDTNPAAASIKAASLDLTIEVQVLPWVEDPCHCD